MNDSPPHSLAPLHDSAPDSFLLTLIGADDREALIRAIPGAARAALRASEARLILPDDVRFRNLHNGSAPTSKASQTILPLAYDGVEYGILLLTGVQTSDSARLTTCAHLIAAALARAARVEATTALERQRVRETDTLAQIDRELSDSINLYSVFEFTLDWALRFTLAHGAYLSLYDDASSTLRPVASLGYEKAPEAVASLFEMSGIPQRVAQTNRLENVPDVASDSDHLPIDITMRSHLSVPITREDRVIAVISLESKQINSFTDAQVMFIVKLCARAGIAIDNARLYADAVREREQTASILREIADVVIVVGYDGRILLINPTAIGVFHLYPNERYVGMRFDQLFEDHRLLMLYRKATASGITLSDQMTLSSERSFVVTFTPHAEIGWIITLHDLTELRRADQLKRDFIAVLSHDLKQPIGVVKGYVELLEMQVPDLDPRARHYMDMIYGALENMRKLIEDMLDLARLDAGIDLAHDPVLPMMLVVSAVEWVRPAAEAKSMQIVTHIPENLPPVRGDAARLTQILVNLVHNAVKYTPPSGIITITAEKHESMIRLSVRDNGIGISPDDQRAIFNRFFRVRRPETENIEGSGIGLTLVKQLIDLHGGQIGLESRLGEGTTFTVSLPIWEEKQ